MIESVRVRCPVCDGWVDVTYHNPTRLEGEEWHPPMWGDDVELPTGHGRECWTATDGWPEWDEEDEAQFGADLLDAARDH